MTDIFGKLSSLKDLLSLGGDALIQVMAGIVDGIGTGTEFSGEQLDQLGELFQQGAEKIRAMRGDEEG